jgi:hypothetical protein
MRQQTSSFAARAGATNGSGIMPGALAAGADPRAHAPAKAARREVADLPRPAFTCRASRRRASPQRRRSAAASRRTA